MKKIKVIIGCGSNLGDSKNIILSATNEINKLTKAENFRSSSLYRTAAVEVSTKQNDYINSVIVFDYPDLGKTQNRQAAIKLFKILQTIEKNHHRQRPYFHAPRTLDLDLLIFGNLQEDINENEINIILPHPRILDRLFVIMPLLEILTKKESQELSSFFKINCLEEIKNNLKKSCEL